MLFILLIIVNEIEGYFESNRFMTMKSELVRGLLGSYIFFKNMSFRKLCSNF